MPDELERVIAVKIDARGAGLSVIELLSMRFTYRDRAGWLERLAAGEFTLNGASVAPDRVLAAGDVLQYRPGDLPEPPVDTRYRIVYRDESLLIVDKPGNLPTHPAGIFFKHTLWYLLRREFGEIYPVNRLDRETSGLLIVARTPVAAARIAKQAYEKRYLALVEGHMTEPIHASGVLFTDASARPVRKKRYFAPVAPDGIPCETAETGFIPLRHGDGMTLVEARPVTGRQHQIRATLCSLGYPMVGDKLYGVDERLFLKIRGDELTDEDFRRLRMCRQALHSAFLRMKHPESGVEMTFESPIPFDFLLS